MSNSTSLTANTATHGVGPSAVGMGSRLRRRRTVFWAACSLLLASKATTAVQAEMLAAGVHHTCGVTAAGGGEVLGRQLERPAR
jgi:hypothetical protein